MLAPFALVSFVVSAVAGRFSERLPLRTGLAVGMLVMAAGVALTRAVLSPDVTWLELLPGLWAQAGFEPTALLATHGDFDHLLGRLAFPGLSLGVAESTMRRIRALAPTRRLLRAMRHRTR